MPRTFSIGWETGVPQSTIDKCLGQMRSYVVLARAALAAAGPAQRLVCNCGVFGRACRGAPRRRRRASLHDGGDTRLPRPGGRDAACGVGRREAACDVGRAGGGVERRCPRGRYGP